MSDDVRTRPIYLVAAATAVVIALAALVVWLAGATRASTIGRGTPAATFDDPPAADAYRRAAAQQLGSWGWVDRDRRRVHIPIERAIEEAAP